MLPRLLLTFRNTLPNTSAFKCSGFAVPYNMAEYTNSDLAGGGLMGPNVPQVSLVLATNPALGSAPTFGGLPSPSSCGQIPDAVPGKNVPSTSLEVDFPEIYWPNTPPYTAPPDLACSSTVPQTTGTQIYFAATQYTSPALTYFLPQGSQCSAVPNTSNGCSQVIIQATQTTEVPSGNPNYPWQPSLAVAITGTGFGFLPFPGTLPWTGPASDLANALGTQHFLTISNNGESTGGASAWTTQPGQGGLTQPCQVYIADWNDSNIWLFLDLPVDVQDGYLEAMDFAPTTYLSPLSDVTWWPFQAVARSPSPTGCPVGYTSTSQFDQLTFQIYNPETGTSASIPVNVSPAGTGLN